MDDFLISLLAIFPVLAYSHCKWPQSSRNQLVGDGLPWLTGVKIHVFSSVHVHCKILMKQSRNGDCGTQVLWHKFGVSVSIIGTEIMRLCCLRVW